MRIDEFDFEFPEELIAEEPLLERDQARLLVVGESLQHKKVFDLPDFLESGDLLILNNTKVIPARIIANRKSGGRVEVLLLEPLRGALPESGYRSIARHSEGAGRPKNLGEILRCAQDDVNNISPQDDEKRECSDTLKPQAKNLTGECWSALLSSSKSLRDGETLVAPGDVEIIVEDGGYPAVIKFPENLEVHSYLLKYGLPPLPPYIRREVRQRDVLQYQTIYAEIPGAVAAPTAGLHFTPRLLEKIDRKEIRIEYITLHVGLGTFQPVRVEEIEKHVMHEERYEISPYVWESIKKGERVVAVGTTTARALESAAITNQLSGRTKLFIYPGFKFQVVDKLMTNFHLPKTTLLMLASAFAGLEKIKAAYREGIKSSYRLFSYGDAMLLERS